MHSEFGKARPRRLGPRAKQLVFDLFDDAQMVSQAYTGNQVQQRVVEQCLKPSSSLLSQPAKRGATLVVGGTSGRASELKSLNPSVKFEGGQNKDNADKHTKALSCTDVVHLAEAGLYETDVAPYGRRCAPTPKTNNRLRPGKTTLSSFPSPRAQKYGPLQASSKLNSNSPAIDRAGANTGKENVPPGQIEGFGCKWTDEPVKLAVQQHAPSHSLTETAKQMSKPLMYYSLADVIKPTIHNTKSNLPRPVQRQQRLVKSLHRAAPATGVSGACKTTNATSIVVMTTIKAHSEKHAENVKPLLCTGLQENPQSETWKAMTKDAIETAAEPQHAHPPIVVFTFFALQHSTLYMYCLLGSPCRSSSIAIPSSSSAVNITHIDDMPSVESLLGEPGVLQYGPQRLLTALAD